MDRTALKNYAPKARREFIQAVTDRAGFYGLTAKTTEPVTEKGDVAIIGGRAFPRSIVRQRLALVDRIQRQGFDQVMEALAYTWFNRFVALRYMELHQYLEHGYRVLSHPEGKATPEILEQAEHLDLPGLDNQKVIELKLDGTKESELYRLLLVAQCNALHEAMPFLFERIDDETELLLPDNLLHSDSVIRKLVNEIEEEDWKEVEIIGWIYQFYISEKKNQVIGKVVKSEDIPAATQLFTPNWIVKYLVQNTLGRQWLATYPDSPIRKQMEYYIEPAEQTEEVKAQLKAITPEILNPEDLTLLDPACGSGHILVEAYDLFKAIYQERGYRSRDIPRIILQKNLYGLEIDDRAAQLAAFALLMKARADDRNIFADHIQTNVLAIQESNGLEKLLRPDPADLTAMGEPLIADQDLFPDTKKQLPLKKPPQESPLAAVEPCLRELIKLFEHGKTFGSLIRVPPELVVQLPAARQSIEAMTVKSHLWEHRAATLLIPLVKQAEFLGKTYDVVVTNPPYMGLKYLNDFLKAYLKDRFDGYERDLFSAFIVRGKWFSSKTARLGFMSPFVWMFISSHENLRTSLLDQSSLTSLVQLEYSGFSEATVPICTFTILGPHIKDYAGSYIRLSDFKGSENQGPKTAEAIRNPACGWFYAARQDDFSKVPGSPISYWVGENFRRLFQRGTPLEEVCTPRQGLATTNNTKFLRCWHEVKWNSICHGAENRASAEESGKRWFPYNKGGAFRRWYGNHNYIIDWFRDGAAVKDYIKNKNPNVARGEVHYFKSGITWGLITSAVFSCRFLPRGFIFDVAGSCAFPEQSKVAFCLGLLNSNITSALLSCLNPTLNTQVGDLQKLPVLDCQGELKEKIAANVTRLIEISKADWDAMETSWDFQQLPLVNGTGSPTIASSYALYEKRCLELLREAKILEESTNSYFIECYQVEGEISPEVPADLITLTRPNHERDMHRFVSYAIGCMMGRYSLDEPGLVYAHSRNDGFDPSQYQTFPADADGIIPLTEVGWFPNDATERVVEFVATAWAREHLEENLKFIADSIGANKGEQPRETIRRYVGQSFFKDHLQTYKKRPIYWLFSSGKQRAFQCLVYLHRYHEGTLARMRTEYVIPIQGKIASRIEQLASDIQKTTLTSHRKKLEKEQDTLKKQQVELQSFDENLRHFADKRISLDLDDGVKVNYGKFGDLLAEVTAVCGKSEDDE